MSPIHQVGLHMLIDVPNVINSRDYTARIREGEFTAASHTRPSLRNIYLLAHANRGVESSLWVGVDRPSTAWVSRMIKAFAPDAEIDLREPGRDSNSEQQITDLVLSARMARLLDYEPGLLVLVTGDGAGWPHGEGMFAAARRLGDREWPVEVLAWSNSLNRHLASWARQSPNALVELDRYYSAITYVAGGRGSGRLDLADRPRAVPLYDAA